VSSDGSTQVRVLRVRHRVLGSHRSHGPWWLRCNGLRDLQTDSSPSQPGDATQRITHQQRAALCYMLQQSVVCCNRRHCVATGCGLLQTDSSPSARSPGAPRSASRTGNGRRSVASGRHCVANAATSCNGLRSVATGCAALQHVVLRCNRFGCATPDCAALQQVAALWYAALLQQAMRRCNGWEKLLVSSLHNYAERCCNTRRLAGAVPTQ
jgi:hypothetical protein